MAYYEEHGGDSQYPGRYNKNYDSGPVGPRRPSMCNAFRALPQIPQVDATSPTDFSTRIQDWLRIMAPQWYNGCEHESLDSEESIGWRQSDPAPAMRWM